MLREEFYKGVDSLSGAHSAYKSCARRKRRDRCEQQRDSLYQKIHKRPGWGNIANNIFHNKQEAARQSVVDAEAIFQEAVDVNWSAGQWVFIERYYYIG